MWAFFRILLVLSAIFSGSKSVAQTPSVHQLLSMYQDSKIYSRVSWLTSHNAFANTEDGWTYAQQSMNISKQFNYGVRSFMVDIYWYEPGGGRPPYLALCHNTCRGAALPSIGISMMSKSPPSPVSDFFNEIKTLLLNNPRDIITLHFESYTDYPRGRPGPIGWQALQPLLRSSGLDSYLNKVDPNDLHLTLGTMRTSNERLVIFSDKLVDTFDPAFPTVSTGIFHTTRYRETEYNLAKYPNCERRADSRAPGLTTNILVMNHFYSLSYAGATKEYNKINNYDELAKRINVCRAQEEIFPNFVAVDFVEEGEYGGAREIVTAINQAMIEGRSSIRLTELPSQISFMSMNPVISFGPLIVGTGACFAHRPFLAAAGVSTFLSSAIDYCAGEYIPKWVVAPVHSTVACATARTLWFLCGGEQTNHVKNS